MPKTPPKSIMVNLFTYLVEFGNRYITLSRWLLSSGNGVFIKVEIMMLLLTILLAIAFIYVHLFPFWLMIAISIIFIQRILEFLIVYSRNFILNKGRVFSHFSDSAQRGQWLVLMFSLNILHLILIFATWYRMISLLDPNAFSISLGLLDSLYFSVVTFLTVGYGDITPIATFPKILVLTQGMLTFYTLVIVINGLISNHFRK